MELEGVFTGKYKNDIVAAVENDNSILVNFLVNHALSDKLGFRLAVNNMFDKNFTEKPGYSEDKYRRRIKIGLIYNF
jgi:outer membrane cobalamin receptor